MEEGFQESESTPDAKVAKPRPRSGVSFPYYNLEQSVEVAKIVHEKGGGACTREQLASYLDYSGVKNGGFLARVSAARMFGLIEQEGDTLRVSERGKKILSPVMEADRDQGLVDAFLSVELFAKVYEEFKGRTLPAEGGLKNLFHTQYKVVPIRVAPTIKILFDSADSAGFFKVPGNRAKMVMPPISGAGVVQPKDTHQPVEVNEEQRSPRRRESVGNGSHESFHPFIEGLLKTLPEPETDWSIAGRVKWLQTASNIFGLIYTSADGEDSSFIAVEKKAL